MSSALRRVIAELVNQTTNGVLDWQRPPGSIGWTTQVGNCIFELRPDLHSLKIVLDDSGDRSSSSYFTRSQEVWELGDLMQWMQPHTAQRPRPLGLKPSVLNDRHRVVLRTALDRLNAD